MQCYSRCNVLTRVNEQFILLCGLHCVTHVEGNSLWVICIKIKGSKTAFHWRKMQCKHDMCYNIAEFVITRNKQHRLCYVFIKQTIYVHILSGIITRGMDFRQASLYLAVFQEGTHTHTQPTAPIRGTVEYTSPARSICIQEAELWSVWHAASLGFQSEGFSAPNFMGRKFWNSVCCWTRMD